MTRNLIGISAHDAPPVVIDREDFRRDSASGCPDCGGEGTVEVQDGVVSNGLGGYYGVDPHYVTAECETCAGTTAIEVGRCSRCHLITDTAWRTEEPVPSHLECACSDDELAEWAARKRLHGHEVWLQMQTGRALIQRLTSGARPARLLRDVGHDLRDAINGGDRDVPVLLPGMLLGAAELTDLIEKETV